MDWSMAPCDIWWLIDSKLEAAGDRFRLRAVCKSFKYFLPFLQQPIWLMLPEEDGDDMRLTSGEESQRPNMQTSPRRSFVVVGEQHIHHLELPEAHGKRCLGSKGSWLITLDINENIQLLNLFSRVQIDLPSQSTLVGEEILQKFGNFCNMNGLVRKMVLSSSPDAKDCRAMAIFHHHNWLAVAKPGDASWTCLEKAKRYIEDIIFFRGQFHIIDSHGALMIYNSEDSRLHFITKDIHTNPSNLNPPRRSYLVEWLGELLVVLRVWPPKVQNHPDPHNTVEFFLWKRDFLNEKWVKIFDLGEHCLFLGLNTSVAVSASDYTTGSLKKNSIYFTANKYENLGMPEQMGLPYKVADDTGVYSMVDGKIWPHYDGNICTPCYSPPIWVIPPWDRTALASDDATQKTC